MLKSVDMVFYYFHIFSDLIMGLIGVCWEMGYVIDHWRHIIIVYQYECTTYSKPHLKLLCSLELGHSSFISLFLSVVLKYSNSLSPWCRNIEMLFFFVVSKHSNLVFLFCALVCQKECVGRFMSTHTHVYYEAFTV